MTTKTVEAKSQEQEKKGQRKALPDGWRWVKLGDVCEVVMGQSPPGTSYNSKGNGEPLLNGPTEFGAVHPKPLQWTTEPIRFAEKNDILFCVRGATTGRKNIADRRYCIGRGLAAIRGQSNATDTNFLYFLLDQITQTLLKETAGSTFPNLSGEKLNNFRIPLPPIAEQKRIVAILGDRLSTIEKARLATEAQLQAARALPAAYLRQIFDSPEAQSWETKPLGDCLTNIQAGKSISCVEIPANLDEWGVLKVNAVSWQKFDPEANKVLPSDFVPNPEHEVKVGDLLISRANTTELVGAVVLVEETRPRLMLSDKTLRLDTNPQKVIKEYLEIILREPRARAFIEENATGTSDSMKNISQELIRKIPISLPSLGIQKNIAQNIKNRKIEIEKIQQSLQEQLETINALPAALLRQAFNGEL